MHAENIQNIQATILDGHQARRTRKRIMPGGSMSSRRRSSISLQQHQSGLPLACPKAAFP